LLSVGMVLTGKHKMNRINKTKLKALHKKMTAHYQYNEFFQIIYPRITKRSVEAAIGDAIEVSYWKDSGGGYHECYFSIYDKPYSEVSRKRDLWGASNYINDNVSGSTRAEATFMAYSKIVKLALELAK